MARVSDRLSPIESSSESKWAEARECRLSPSSAARASLLWIASGRHQAPITTRRHRGRSEKTPAGSANACVSTASTARRDATLEVPALQAVD
eukprot:2990629-Pyramimonas_sp.AAC.1